jgi:hypothetical protein
LQRFSNRSMGCRLCQKKIGRATVTQVVIAMVPGGAG